MQKKSRPGVFRTQATPSYSSLPWSVHLEMQLILVCEIFTLREIVVTNNALVPVDFKFCLRFQLFSMCLAAKPSQSHGEVVQASGEERRFNTFCLQQADNSQQLPVPCPGHAAAQSRVTTVLHKWYQEWKGNLHAYMHVCTDTLAHTPHSSTVS